MSEYNCACRMSCSSFAVVLSTIVAIITAILRYTAVITISPVFLWVLFGTATAYLLSGPVITSFINRKGTRGCACSIVPITLIGLVGTIIASIVLLAIEFVATSLIGAIIAGALLGFFTLIITSVACLAKCIACSLRFDEN